MQGKPIVNLTLEYVFVVSVCSNAHVCACLCNYLSLCVSAYLCSSVCVYLRAYAGVWQETSLQRAFVLASPMVLIRRKKTMREKEK